MKFNGSRWVTDDVEQVDPELATAQLKADDLETIAGLIDEQRNSFLAQANELVNKESTLRSQANDLQGQANDVEDAKNALFAKANLLKNRAIAIRAKQAELKTAIEIRLNPPPPPPEVEEPEELSPATTISPSGDVWDGKVWRKTAVKPGDCNGPIGPSAAELEAQLADTKAELEATKTDLAKLQQSAAVSGSPASSPAAAAAAAAAQGGPQTDATVATGQEPSAAAAAQ